MLFRSLGGEKFRGLVAEHRGDADVLTQSCPGLVEQIESGDLDGPATRALVERYTGPLVAAGADVLVLGCTHYPLLKDAIAAAAAEIAGRDLPIVDGAAATADAVTTLLRERALGAMSTSGPPRLDLLVTDLPASFAEVAARFLGGEPPSVRQIDL